MEEAFLGLYVAVSIVTCNFTAAGQVEGVVTVCMLNIYSKLIMIVLSYWWMKQEWQLYLLQNKH